MTKLSFLIFFIFIGSASQVWACTNFLFTKSTTKDGYTAITYTADSQVIYGEL